MAQIGAGRIAADRKRAHVQTTRLNNGIEMPLLGFGVFQVRDLAECERAASEALRVGYRLIDTAASYLNEEAVGRAIRASGVPRGYLFVTTELWVQDAGYERAKSAFERSAKRLGLDYLDLYLIHQPFGDIHGAWRALEELYRNGRAKAIGVSNFPPDRLMDLIVNNEVVPAVDQIEVHPFYQRAEALEFCRTQGVQVEAWAPFAEGKHSIFQNQVLRSVAAKHEKTVAQIILRWLTQRGTAAIPKSVRAERIAENFDVFGFDLSPEDLAAIATLELNESSFFDHRDPAMVKSISERKLDI
jgi:diketogulonate reductase-like aldo/keto reductase